MNNPNWFQKLQSKRINTLAKFLKILSRGNIQNLFVSEKFGSEYNIFVPTLLINFLKVAVQRKYLIGVSIASSADETPIIIIDSPVITPEGESYIASKGFLSRNPIIEKFLFIVLTGLVSALATYLASPPPAP